MHNTESRTVHIATTPNDLWTLLTAAAGVADWYDDWDAVEVVDGGQRLDCRTEFCLIRHRGGHRQQAKCQVTVFDPPRRLAWTEDQPPRPTVFVDFVLTPGPNDDTELTLSKTY